MALPVGATGISLNETTHKFRRKKVIKMIKDITLGQYFPLDSFLHRLDPRMKIILSILYITLIFMATTVYSLAAVLVITLILPLFGKIPYMTVIKSIKPLWLIIVFMLVIFTLNGGGEGYHILWDWSYGIIHITISVEGIIKAVALSLRIILLVVSTSVILSYTTSPIALSDAIEELLSPLAKIKLPVHDFAMMITIAMRFIPILVEETDKIMSAQASRGADFKSGSLIKKAKALIPVFIPLFASSVRHADDLATAMECRCYRGGKGRTKMKRLAYSTADFVAYIVMLLLLFGVIVIVHQLGGFSYTAA